MDGMQKQVETVDESFLRAKIKEVLQQSDMTSARLARESGVSKARISFWLNEKYTGDNETVCADLGRWLRSSQAGEGVAASVTDWQPTPTGNRILRALLYAQNDPDMALIYSGAGVGKTCAARHYREENPNVWLATMTPAVKSVSACLGRIAALNISDCPRSAIGLENAIVRRLEGTKGLLIVDEAQFLSSESLEAVRSLYDASGAGIAFMGKVLRLARLMLAEDGADLSPEHIQAAWAELGGR